MVARLIAAAEASEASGEVVGALVTGAVGEGAGLELLTWLSEMDLPDPEEILADPAGALLPDRGDRLYALLTAVAAAVASRPTGPRWLAGWAILARAGEAAPDVAAMAARALARCRPEGMTAPPEAAVFAPLWRNAGLL